jgi:hypothetical protein
MWQDHNLNSSLQIVRPMCDLNVNVLSYSYYELNKKAKKLDKKATRLRELFTFPTSIHFELNYFNLVNNFIIIIIRVVLNSAPDILVNHTKNINKT